ncbi:hypothetical protein ACHAWX_003805 [Stephanocyclus meneghinianus]
MSFEAAPARVEEFDGTVIEDFNIARPTSAPYYDTRSTYDASRRVHVIEPDEDDSALSSEGKKISSGEESSFYSIARLVREQFGPPRNSSKASLEHAERKHHAPTTKRSLPRVHADNTPQHQHPANSKGPNARLPLSIVSPTVIRKTRYNRAKPQGRSILEMLGQQDDSPTSYNNAVMTHQGGVSRERYCNVVDNCDYSSDEEENAARTRPSANDDEVRSLLEMFSEVNLSNSKRIATLEDANERLRNQLQCPVCYELQEGNMYLIIKCGHRGFIDQKRQVVEKDLLIGSGKVLIAGGYFHF